VKEQAKLSQQLTKSKKYSIFYENNFVSVYILLILRVIKCILHNELILPSPRTLQRSIEMLQIQPGLNDIIFDTMKKEFSILHYWTGYV